MMIISEDSEMGWAWQRQSWFDLDLFYVVMTFEGSIKTKSMDLHAALIFVVQ